MSVGIAVTNHDELAARVRAVRDVLDEWLTELDRVEPDAEGLRRRFEKARAVLE